MSSSEASTVRQAAIDRKWVMVALLDISCWIFAYCYLGLGGLFATCAIMAAIEIVAYVSGTRLHRLWQFGGWCMCAVVAVSIYLEVVKSNHNRPMIAVVFLSGAAACLFGFLKEISRPAAMTRPGQQGTQETDR